METIEEMLAYLHALIDPRDRLNPKYHYVRQQIEGIQNAKAKIAAPVSTVVIRIPT